VAASCWSEPETVVDSARYFTQAKYLELHGASYFLREWGKAIFTWTDMPLMPFLYGIVFRLIGEHRVAIEALNTALFSSAVATLYLLGKELWDAETGFYAGLLLMGIPFIINQTPFMLVDVPSMSFFILSIYFFVLALKRGGFLVPVAAVFIFLAAVSKYTNWVWLSTLPVSAAVLIAQALHGGEKEKARGFLKNAVIAFFFGALLIGLFITAKWEVLKGQMALLVSYQKPGFSRWAESYLSTFLFQCHPFVTVLALGGLYQGIRKKDWDMIIALWPVLLLFLLGIKRSRYTVDVLPMLALMGARGLSALEVRRLKNFIALSVLVSSSVIAVFAYKPFLESTSPVNIKNAAKFIDGLEGTCVRVYTITSPGDDVNLAVTVPMLDLFTGKKCLLHESNSGYLPSSQEIAASPLRFTWEYHTPPFYLPREITGAKEEKNLPIVVISDERDAQYPPELREKIRPLTHSKEFMLEDNIYVFQSLVKVFY
jgi:4-amino-4-deoxy-L-arabinose transferase-like glycosyltransferase